MAFSTFGSVFLASFCAGEPTGLESGCIHENHLLYQAFLELVKPPSFIRTGRDFAIYENEYGQADIDARRLRQDSATSRFGGLPRTALLLGQAGFCDVGADHSNTIDPSI